MSFGTKGWLGLVAYVAIFDLVAGYTNRETLSGAFYRAFLHPRQRWIVIVAWVYLTLHLFAILPARFDPLRAFRLPFK